MCQEGSRTGSSVKRRVLIRKIEEMGCALVRHGGRHDWYQNPETKVCQPVPGHNEIKDNLAKHILKKLKN